MTSNTPNVPQILLERFVLGELTDVQVDDLKQRLGEDELNQRAAAIRASNEAVLKRLPARVFAAAVSERASTKRSSSLRLWLPVLVAAIGLIAIVPQLIRQEDGLEITRAKGVPQLQVHRRGPGEPERLDLNTVVDAGDVLQLSYTAAGAEYGAIVSLDGNGAITWHLPRNGRTAVQLQPGGAVPLDHSYELDDAPAFERFIFVTSSSDFELQSIEEEVRRWAQSGGELSLTPPLNAAFFSVEKGTP